MTQEQTDRLEALVDETTLSVVLDTLEEITTMKAQHIRETWQDEETAKAWDQAVKYMNKIPLGQLEV